MPPAALDPAPLDVPRLTWAAVLGRWVEFSRGAVALPADATGRRMRASVPDIIMVQAVWFALGELNELDAAERAVGLDRAAILIEKHAGALERRWRRPGLPAAVRELIADARARLAREERSEE
jgi:hypothetical protein